MEVEDRNNFSCGGERVGAIPKQSFSQPIIVSQLLTLIVKTYNYEIIPILYFGRA